MSRAQRMSLTPRGAEVLERIRRGMTNKEIAAELRISEQTVKHHVARLLFDNGVESRVELALLEEASVRFDYPGEDARDVIVRQAPWPVLTVRVPVPLRDTSSRGPR